MLDATLTGPASDRHAYLLSSRLRTTKEGAGSLVRYAPTRDVHKRGLYARAVGFDPKSHTFDDGLLCVIVSPDHYPPLKSVSCAIG